jgi:hypothetical protein
VLEEEIIDTTKGKGTSYFIPEAILRITNSEMNM